MNVFISGGCKNGKSYYAQRQAQMQAIERDVPLYYIATMIPRDGEDRERINRHLKDREGWGFETIEQPVNLTEILKREDVDKKGSFLLDSVTAILENEMFPRVAADKREEAGAAGLKGRNNIEIHEDQSAPERVRKDMVAFAKAIKEAGGNVVFVSDGIYGDGGEYSATTENYRKSLADTDRALAAECDRVIEISYGTETIWK